MKPETVDPKPSFLRDQYSRSRFSSFIPIGATIVWLAWVVCLWVNADLPLNEQGDFFAGFVSPIAIMWLVLGYLQQGKELRLNTRALELQIEELNESVKQQTIIAQASQAQQDDMQKRKAKDLEREIVSKQPRINSETRAILDHSTVTLVLQLTNNGQLARNVAFETDIQQCKVTSAALDFFQKSTKTTVKIEIPKGAAEDFYLLMKYTDELGSQRIQYSHIVPSGMVYKESEFIFELQGQPV